jgi:hypothetical protein
MGRTLYTTLLLSVHLILAVCAVVIVSPAVTDGTNQADPTDDGVALSPPEMSVQTIDETIGRTSTEDLWETSLYQQKRLNLSFAEREGHQRRRGEERPRNGQVRYMRGFAP